MDQDLKNTTESYKIDLLRSIDQINTTQIDKVAKILHDVWRNHHRLLICGNGGSAAMASHFVADLSKGIAIETGEHGMDARCLTDNIPLLTAWSNDVSYVEALACELKNEFKTRKKQNYDCLLIISSSGNSKNIMEVLKAAKELKLDTITLTGCGGGEALIYSPVPLVVNSDDIQICEDIHGIMTHMIFRKVVDIVKSQVQVSNRQMYIQIPQGHGGGLDDVTPEKRDEVRRQLELR